MKTRSSRRLDLQKARATLPLTLNQKRLALAKLKHDHRRSAEKLADLRKDREAMIIHAPADGLVYYGRNDAATGRRPRAWLQKLRKGGMVMADEVSSRWSLFARSTSAPRSRRRIYTTSLEPQRAERAASTPAADPAPRLPPGLTSVLPVPREPGKFESIVDVEIGQTPPSSSRAWPARQVDDPIATKNALIVPATAVFEDDSPTMRHDHAVPLPSRTRTASPRSDRQRPARRPAARPRSSMACTQAMRS